MFQKKQIIYSASQGVCQVENIVQLSTGKGAPSMQYYVLKPLFDEEKVSYIPVENHQVQLRELFTLEEAKALVGSESVKKDEKLKQAVEYVIGQTENNQEE